MLSKVLLALPAVALAFAPAATSPRAPAAALNSWQPNRDFNAFGAADSLSREERSQRFAGASDRTVTLQKPLGVVLEQDAQKNVYVAQIDQGGSADLSGQARERATAAPRRAPPRRDSFRARSSRDATPLPLPSSRARAPFARCARPRAPSRSGSATSSR